MIRVLHEELSRVHSCTWVGWNGFGRTQSRSKECCEQLGQSAKDSAVYVQRYNTWVAEDFRKASKSPHTACGEEVGPPHRPADPTRGKEGEVTGPRSRTTTARSSYVRAKETSPRRTRERDRARRCLRMIRESEDAYACIQDTLVVGSPRGGLNVFQTAFFDTAAAPPLPRAPPRPRPPVPRRAAAPGCSLADAGAGPPATTAALPRPRSPMSWQSSDTFNSNRDSSVSTVP